MSYVVVLLSHNEIQYIELFFSRLEAEFKAILLANEWHKLDGVKSFGLCSLKTISELKKYHRSDAYFNSEDAVNICVEQLSTRIYYDGT